MARERIPDAKLGSAPGLEICQHAGRGAASAGGESTHSQALTYLSNKRLEGFPISQKIGGTNKFFDSRGKEITYEQACDVAEGVIFYQDAKDPRKGRLRQRGSFFSEDKARTIIESSRAASDTVSVADMRNLEGFPEVAEDLHTIKEDDREIHESDADATQTTAEKGTKKSTHTTTTKETSVEVAEDFPRTKEDVRASHRSDTVATQKTEKKATVGLMGHLICFVFLLASGTSILSVARHRSDSDHQATIEHVSRPYLHNLPLDPEIVSLLKADEMGEDEVSVAFLDMPEVAEENVSSRRIREQQAAAEIDRILSSRKESDILGPEPLSQQQREFHRIALLLHPDKGLVSAGDERASVALRLALAARRRVLARR